MGDLDIVGSAARNISSIITVVAGACASAALLLFYRFRDKFVTRKEFEELKTDTKARLDRHDNRLNDGARQFDELKREMRAVATREDIHVLALAVKDQEGDFKALLEQVKGMRHTLEYLVEQKNR